MEGQRQAMISHRESTILLLHQVLDKVRDKSFWQRAVWTGTTAPSPLGHGATPVWDHFAITPAIFAIMCPSNANASQTLRGLCSYAQISPMVEMSLVLEAPTAQRPQQRQDKALHAHLKLQVAFPVGSIAKSRAAFSLGIFQIWSPAWSFQAASYSWKKVAHHCLSQYFWVFAQLHHALSHQALSTALHPLAVCSPGTNWLIWMCPYDHSADPCCLYRAPQTALTPTALQFLTNIKHWQQMPLPTSPSEGWSCLLLLPFLSLW